MTANPPQMVSLRGKGAGSGVIHAPGVPGAPPLREISIDEVTCADGSISSAVRATRMGNTDSAPALDDLFQGAAAPAPPSSAPGWPGGPATATAPAGSSAVSGSCEHTGTARPTDPDARCARRSSSPSTSKDPSTSRCGSATPSRSGTTRKSVDGTALYVAAEPGPSGVRLRRSVISCRCFGLGSADGARSGYRRDRVP